MLVGNKNFCSLQKIKKYAMENHKNRKLNRLKGYDYSHDGWYFVTICAKNREHFFGEITGANIELSEIGKIARKCWEEIPTHFPNIKLDEFIIMPNHIHGIIIIENNIVENNNYRNKNFCSLQQQPWQTKWAYSLSSIVRGFKIGVTKYNNTRLQFTWQKSYYDHIIRNENSLNKIREYIVNNPLKWEFDRNNTENLWM